ncbi:MAG: hypothetical protein KIS77_11410 [Saprospiraceae bacterium]|nr:hypothetical protein [Saprospiraceae bacterium]
MRKIATLLLFIGSLCAANSQEADKQLRNCDSVFMRSDTLVCLKNVSSKLKVLKFYKDGERLFTRTVTKQKNGDIEIYTTKKRFSQKYEGEGLILHPNGQVKVRSWYKNGRVDGPSLTYYEDGKRQCVCRYKNDVRDGEQFVFITTVNYTPTRCGKKAG